jgi:hypothetical protein
MQLTLIKNNDESQIAIYKIARIVYAETGGASLAAAEALASMIGNLCRKSLRQLSDIAEDKKIFPCLSEKNSAAHKRLFVNADDAGFQMCLRAARKMAAGNLPDCVSGATRFHHADEIPDWATAVGYIAEVGGLLFYI